MEITLIQAILIALMAWLTSQPTPFLLGTTGGFWSMGRPLVAGLIVGLILGDPVAGTMIGASISVIFLGVITPGGAVATDVVFAGYMGTTIALISGVDTEVAVALAVPLGLFGAFTWNVWSTINVPITHMADASVARGETKGLWMYAVLIPQILNFIFRFIPVFLVAFYGEQIGASIDTWIPAWLNSALGSIGGMLPALGMAILLKTLVKDSKQWAFFLGGFVLVAVMGMSFVPVTIVGISIALFTMYILEQRPAMAQGVNETSQEEDFF